MGLKALIIFNALRHTRGLTAALWTRGKQLLGVVSVEVLAKWISTFRAHRFMHDLGLFVLRSSVCLQAKFQTKA